MGDAKLVLDGEFNPSSILGSVRQIQGAFNGLKLPANMTGNMIKDFDKLKEVMTKIKDLSNKQTFNNADMKSLNKLSSQADSLFSKISNSMDELSGKQIYLEADMTKIKAVETELDNIKAKIQSELSNLKINMDAGGVTKSLGMDQIVADMEKGVRSSKVLSAAMQDAKQAITAGDFSKAGQIFGDIEQKAVSLKGAGSGLLETFRQWGVISFQGPAKDITDTQTKADLLSKAMTQLITQLNTSNGGQVFKDLNKDLSDTTNKLENVKRAAEANYSNSMKGLAGQVRDTGQAASKTTDEMKRMGQSTLDAANQIKQLQQSTQYFFGLRNMINLLRRGVTQAIDTIKELDKAMTQTAVVVPEWDVGDMWAKLPEYTKNANELGASVVDLYRATTLYYQQGLRGNEVMDVAAETMKMARIGGLDAADATDKMTAALRGFNMEVNQESAQRINDVYSNLAANSASNTEELGTAMQRTASIAASAGMSFEGTSAFLAQAIETTREPAENLGTAMKTIVARFTELKKNPLEITDVDGEEVSYNKVDTALQSIGVSLKDTNGQFRDLDQVFLDISQRWDSLTQTQQRYVATTAAGSRQQSRFIAMMSNYKRTQELMGFANNSEGASQKQFDKTLESFEVKVTKLRNAWDKFLMGITDNTFIKGAVDGLTALIGGIGTLIDKLSGGIGPVKSFMSLMTAFVGLKMGGRLINSLIGGLGGMVDPTSSFTGGFHAGMTGRGNPALASQIYTPIVNAINGLKGAVNGSGPMTSQRQQYQLYKNSVSNIKGLGSTFKSNDLLKNLTGSKQTQSAIMDRYSGSFRAVTNSMMSGMTKRAVKFNKGKDNGISSALKQGEGFLANQRKLGEISAKEYYNSLKDPALMQKALHDSGVKDNNPAMAYLKETNDQINTQAQEMTAKKLPEVRKNALDAYDAALKKNPNMKMKFSREEFESRLNSKEFQDKMTNAQRQRIINDRFNNTNTLTAGQRIENGFKQIGGAMTSAGMGLQSLGSTLQNSANPAVAAFGTTLSSMGGILTSAGMAVNGLTAAVTTVVGAIGIVPAVILAAVAALYIWKKHQEKVTKERAEEITNDYKEKSKNSEKNISNLESWKSELPRLSQGVDANGNNVSLDSGDYQHYLEIVDEIAKLNPEIVKGYNAQGHAIIDNNSALEKTLALEKDRQKQNVEEYTSKDAMEAMVAARDLNRVEQGTEEMKGAGWRSAQARQRSNKDKTYKLAPQEDMENQAKEMARTLKENGFSDKDFKSLGISLDALEQGDAQAVAKLQNNIDGFTAHSKALMSAAGDDIAKDAEDTFNKAAEGFTKSSGELDEMITPVYEQLSAKMVNDGKLQQIPEDMATFFNQGLKTIAADANLSSDEMVSESNKLANAFADLSAKGGEYDQVMADIEVAQQKFGDDLDTAAYDEAADKAVKDLEKIKDGVDSTSSYGQALTEFLDNQMTQITSFTEQSAVDVSEALNTMSDEISAAEGAVENFKKVAEGSNYSTAAKGMKEIYDTVTEAEDGKVNEHKAGKGDQTYWAAAENLFGRDEIKNKSKEQVDKMLKNMEPMLQEGEAGWKEFKNRWFETFDAGKFKDIKGLELYDNGWIKKWDDSVNPDVYTQMADALDMSEETLTSMLNKGRQFSDISFTNLEDVRQGLATGESVIQGQSSKNGKKTLYMKEDTLNAELANSGMSVKEQEETKTKLAKDQNVQIIKEVSKIGKAEFKDMGIQTQKSLITAFGDTGQYTKEEIQEYAEKFAQINGGTFDQKAFDDDFKKYQALEDPVQGEQLKTLDSLDSSVMSIAQLMQQQAVRGGQLTDFKGKELKEKLWGEKGKNDTEAQLFAQGLKKNADGSTNFLTRDEYIKSRDQLASTQKESEAYLKDLNAGLKAAEKAGDKEQVKAYEKEIKDITDVIASLKKYQKEGREAYRNTQNEKINAVNAKTGNLLGDKTWKDFKGEKKQNALQDIYDATLEPKELTSSFQKSLDTLKITAEQAFENGLITKESYDKFQEKAKKDQENKNNAEQQGVDEANKEETEKKKTKGKKDQEEKNNAEDQATNEEADRQAREESEKKEREQYARQAEQEKAAQQAELERQQKLQQLREQFSETVVPPGVNPQDILGEAFGQYTSEEAQQAGQNLKDSLKSLFDNLISPETLDTNSAKAAEAETQIAQLGASLGLSTEATKELIGKNKFLAAAEQMVGESSDKAKQGNEKLKSELEQMGKVKPDKLIKFKEELQKAASPSMPKKEKGKEEKQETIMPPSVQKAEDHESTFKVKTEDKELDKTEKKIDETTKKANKGATYTLKVQGGKDLSKGVQKAEAKDKTIKVNYTKGTQEKATSNTAVVDYKLGKQELPKPKSTQVNYTLGSQVNPSPKTVDISPNFTGTWVKRLKIIKDDARGQNNTGGVPSVPAFGSAASGTSRPGTGRLGPKGKGGLTLTGEEGYEVAWLPRQNRSMILGVNGPEMLNLPSDAVVWNHKQSEQIVKKNAIPSGSAWVGAGSAPYGTAGREERESGSKTENKGNNNNNNNKNNKNKDKKDKDKDKQNKIAAKLAKGFQKIVQKGGKLSVWWDNQTRKVDAILRKVDKNQKKWETQLNKVGNTLSSMTSYTKAYEKVLAQSIKLNQQSKKRANSELKKLSGQKGSGKRVSISYDYTKTTFSKKQRKSKEFKKAKKEYKNAEKEQRAAEKALAKAEKTKSKKDDKAAKRRLKKAQKRLKKADKKLRKTGTTKDTKKEKINISKYVKFDPETGTYIIDQKAISKVAKKNKSKAKAIKDKANDLIDKSLQRRNTAEDNIEKARDSLRKIGADIYEQFYGWKDELTKIFRITQKIAQTEEKRNRLTTGTNLIEAMLKSGIITASSDFAKMGGSIIGATAKSYAISIKQEAKLIKKIQSEFDETYNLTDLRKKQEEYLFTIEVHKYQEAQKQLKAAKKGSKAWKDASKAAQDAVDKVKRMGYTESDLKNAKNVTKEKYEEAIGARDAFNQGILGGANFGRKYFSAALNPITGMYEYDFNQSKYNRDKAADTENKATYEQAYDWIQQVIEVINKYNEHWAQLNQHYIDLNNMLRDLRESYADYADELLQAYEDQKQAEVDKLDAIYNCLNDHIRDLLDKVKKNLDSRRQKEDNAKTEEDINNKQQRLARLRANTSGGNRAEIAQLEKEIADAQNSYGRTLEDQLLAKLEEQADEAAKQRERQIKILTAQLQLDHATGVNAAHIDQLLQDIQGDNEEQRAAALAEITALYKANNEYESQTSARIKLLDADFQVLLNTIDDFDSEESNLMKSIDAVEDELELIKAQIAALVDNVNKDFRENTKYSATFVPNTSEREGELNETIDLENADLTSLRAARKKKVANRDKWIEKETDSKGKIAKLKNQLKFDFTDIKEKEKVKKQLKAEQERLATIQGHVADRDKDIAAIDKAIAAAQANITDAKDELANLQKQETYQVTYKLSDVEAVMHELKLDVGSDFGSMSDLTEQQTKRLANLSDEEIKKLAEETKLSEDQLRAMQEQAKNLKNSKPVVNVYVDKNGNVSYDNGGNNGGNGGESDKEDGGGKGNGGIDKNSAEYKAYETNINSSNQKVLDREAAGKTGFTSAALTNTLARAEAAGVSAHDAVIDLIKQPDITGTDVISAMNRGGWSAAEVREVFGPNATKIQKKQFEKVYGIKYAKGGFASFTGPAWLDGTRAKPEAVLSATDTKNFVQLRDILSDVMGHISNSETSYGNITYDIDVNVERLASDYDVDKVAKRIEKIITKDASYRNVTQVRKFR